MNEKQRKEQAQISAEENIERIRNTPSEEMIAKYFQTDYTPQTPDINKARKRRREKTSVGINVDNRAIII